MRTGAAPPPRPPDGRRPDDHRRPRRPDQARRGSALHHRQGPLPRRHQADGDDLHGHPAQPIRPRQHPLDRHLGGQDDARRRRGHHRRGHPVQPAADGLAGRRLRRDPEQRQHAPGRSRPTASSGPARASPRSSPRRPSRRSTRSRRSRSTGSRCRRSSTPRRRSSPARRSSTRTPRTTSSSSGPSATRPGTDAAIDDGRGRRPPAPRQPAADPEPDGGPRRHRPVQPGHRRIHGLDVEPDAAHPAAPADRLRDRDPRAQGPLHRAGRRRRVRDEDLLLRRHGPRDVRAQADRRAAGQVGRDAGARTTRRTTHGRDHITVPRDRRQARRRDHRAPGQDVRQPRRPPVDDRPRHPDDALRPGPRRAATRSRTSTARSPASTRTRRSSTPIAAPAGPEATYVIERAMDLFADEIGMDPAAIRRKNFIAARPVPVREPVGPRARPSTARRSTSTPATTSRPSTRP